MEEGGQCLVNSTKGVKDCLGSIRATPARFKTLTNFILDKFDDMCLDEVSIIATHAHTTGGGVGGGLRAIHVVTNTMAGFIWVVFKSTTTLCMNHLCEIGSRVS